MSKKIFTVFSLLLVFVFITSVTQPAYSSNEGKMRVWVEFSPGSAARVEKALNGIGAEFHYRFEDLNSFVVTVPEQAVAGLRNKPNVVSIEEDAIRYPTSEELPTVPYGIDMVQARDIWDADRDGAVDDDAPTGSGVTVCIIDSGIYADHEDFAGVNIVGGYTNINGTSFDVDGFGHGTHVAGTITAALNNTGVVGVNPGDVSLFIVKVFGDDGLWAYSSTLVDAANRCGNAGAEIISMSLGGTQKSKLEERAFNTLYTNGVLSIAAAGNDGNTAISYPGGYASVMAVAAIDEEMVVADFSQQNNTVEIAAPGVGVLSTVPYINVANLTVDGVEYSVNQMEYAGLGSASGSLVDGGICDSPGNWSGAVVLCERGTNDFINKVQNVEAGGGEATVIYNNASGNFLGTLGEDGLVSIPAVSLSQEDGQYLVANKLGLNAEVFTDSTRPASGYEAWDGTSMATPHVSGVAALIWSANPDWTNAEIREALTASALDLGAAGRDNAYGYGLVQAADALEYLGWTPPSPTPTPSDTPTATPTTPTPTNTPTPTETLTPTPTGTPTSTPEPYGTMKVTVSTNASYNINETVTVEVEALDLSSGTAIVEADVNVVVKNARGKTVATLNGVTNNVGIAYLPFKLTRNMGTGIYSVVADVTKTNYTPASDGTTFVVN